MTFMNWRLYKKDEPDTWPTIVCNFIVCIEDTLIGAKWSKKYNCFVDAVFQEEIEADEYFYAYVLSMPKRCVTHNVAKCINDENCPYGCDDDGYCMYDNLLGSDTCGSKRIVNEYEIGEELVYEELLT